MDYDFSGLCADQMEKLNKRLTALHKAYVKQYEFALNIINNSNQNEHRKPILQEAESILWDQLSRIEIFYTEAMNKVQKVLAQHL